MPDQQDEETIETKRGELPAATPAPSEDLLTEAFETAALTDEELREREEAIGGRRKPAGPPLGPGPAAENDSLAESADVPETNVIETEGLENE